MRLNRRSEILIKMTNTKSCKIMGPYLDESQGVADRQVTQQRRPLRTPKARQHLHTRHWRVANL